MDKRTKANTLCWNCYKATNGKWCPFVNNVNNSVDGWTVEHTQLVVHKHKREVLDVVIVKQCPLYIYDYDVPRITEFLCSKNIPPKEFNERMQSIQSRLKSYNERNDSDLNKYLDYYKDIRLYQTYESNKSAEELSEEYVNGDK